MPTKVDTETEWSKEWPDVNGFYWLRGWRHYTDLPIKVDGDEFWMMFNLASNHRADLGDSDNVQFLGPLSPSDFEQLIQLRRAARSVLQMYGDAPMPREVEALREALGESNA